MLSSSNDNDTVGTTMNKIINKKIISINIFLIDDIKIPPKNNINKYYARN